MKKQAQIQG